VTVGDGALPPAEPAAPDVLQLAGEFAADSRAQ
jgi:hypothetical protein